MVFLVLLVFFGFVFFGFLIFWFWFFRLPTTIVSIALTF